MCYYLSIEISIYTLLHSDIKYILKNNYVITVKLLDYFQWEINNQNNPVIL